MNELLKQLHHKIASLGDTCRRGVRDQEVLNPLINDVILAFAELYKHPEVKLYMPAYQGNMSTYQEDDRFYIFLSTAIPENQENAIDGYKEVSLKEICDYAYDNAYYYDQFDHLIDLLGKIDLKELGDYLDRNPRFAGVILDPLSDDPFALEGWMLQAVIFKGMGAVSFDTYDPETGEVTHKL